MHLIKVFFILILIASCKPDKVEEPEVEKIENSLIVLCEGLYQQNNSSISKINLSGGSVNTGFFQQQVNRQLGDTGNDMIRYGGKIYIVVNSSSTIEVLSSNDFSEVKQIQMEQSGTSKQPRFAVGYGSNVYVSCYDGYVDVIDTVTLSIVTRIPVGSNPENIAISNGKMYVSNSGGLNFPDLDSTVSVIDLGGNIEIKKITVGLNPGAIEVDDEGDIYVVTRGDFGAVLGEVHRIDSDLDEKTQSFNIQATNLIRFISNSLLIANFDYNTNESSILIFDSQNDVVTSSSLFDLSSVDAVYNVKYDSNSSRVFISDAKNFTTSGSLHIFSEQGQKLSEYQVGLNPSKVIVYE